MREYGRGRFDEKKRKGSSNLPSPKERMKAFKGKKQLAVKLTGHWRWEPAYFTGSAPVSLELFNYCSRKSIIETKIDNSPKNDLRLILVQRLLFRIVIW